MVQPSIAVPSASSGTATPSPGVPWHALSIEDALASLDTDAKSGLSTQEAVRRRLAYGPNQLAAERRVTFWAVAREEVTEPMILLLLVVAVIYSISGELRDGVAIFLIIAGITFVEIFNEYRAKDAIASLRRLSAPIASLVRDGHLGEVPAKDLVPGDLVFLSAGRRVPADVRLLDAIGLRVDESSLTGESIPASKGADSVSYETELHGRRAMAYAGTLVTTGKGCGLVVATGMATEIGKIAGLVRSIRDPRTPLQTAMRQLAGWLVWLALGFSLAIPMLGFLFGQPLREMILTALTLAFATIPEELPILITIVLGLGALSLSRRRAIVKRLRAAETLGSVSAIASDKTGTITENRMAVVELCSAGRSQALSTAEAIDHQMGRMILELGVLASDAVIDPAVTVGGMEPFASSKGKLREGYRNDFAGDPTDRAFFTAAKSVGLNPTLLRGDGPVTELPFDENRRMMSAVYRRDGGMLVAAKGAPEAILTRCRFQAIGRGDSLLEEDSRGMVLETARQMAARGLRVLAMAYKILPSGALANTVGASESSATEVETDLVFAGLAGLLDPPRTEVPASLDELRGAGIRVLMLTGDHPDTARAIASQVGIDAERVMLGREIDAMSDGELRSIVREISVYARIAPEHKLKIVRALQASGEVVAVTGDGVNDAPALKEAAIGIAMGQTGTDVAKEAADMVLGDDNFTTIGVAVREGRKLYENLRKAVRYYLAAKVALISSCLIAVLAHLPLPFSPIQIIVTELFMDLAASVAFTMEPAEGDVMARKARDPRHPFMDRAMQTGIFAGGLSLGAAVIFAYLYSLSQGTGFAHARGVAFATWMIGHVVLALHMRSERQPLSAAGLLSNRVVVAWGLAACVVAILAANVPDLSQTLEMASKTTSLNVGDWLVAIAAPAITTAWWEAWKLWSWRTR